MELVYLVVVVLFVLFTFKGLEAIGHQDHQTETIKVEGKAIPYENQPGYMCIIVKGGAMYQVSKDVFDSVEIGDHVLQVHKTLRLGKHHFKIYDYKIEKMPGEVTPNIISSKC